MLNKYLTTVLQRNGIALHTIAQLQEAFSVSHAFSWKNKSENFSSAQQLNTRPGQVGFFSTGT